MRTGHSAGGGDDGLAARNLGVMAGLDAGVWAGVMLPYAWRVLDNAVVPVLAIFAATFVPCPIAAFKIGVGFSSPRWPAGPPVAVLATLVAILLMPSPSLPRQTALGMTTPKDEMLFVLIWGGWFLLVALAAFYALLARAGVRKGERREGERWREERR